MHMEHRGENIFLRIHDVKYNQPVVNKGCIYLEFYHVFLQQL